MYTAHPVRQLIYGTIPGYYWAVQLVLSGNLHSGDAEATQYTTALLDDLEAVCPQANRRIS